MSFLYGSWCFAVYGCVSYHSIVQSYLVGCAPKKKCITVHGVFAGTYWEEKDYSSDKIKKAFKQPSH